MSLIAKAISNNSLRLGLFATLTVGLIALTYVFTQDRIAAQIRASEQRALADILPQDYYDNDLLHTYVMQPAEPLISQHQPFKVYVAFKQQQPSAVVIPVAAPDGYNGRIELLVGIDHSGKLTGTRVIAHKETPGLGDAIDSKVSDWINNFAGKSLLSPTEDGWAVKKDGGEFDQFTGATITPRAVVAAVKRSLDYFNEHQATLFHKGAKKLEELNHG
ncbi:electron transport complex subunit RsxG [Spartinivicinus ruber]|uniref:electron transport complex subunit RsxG n=1 Tax=Spartinivicinus ruber TaxID=2683272 RepID=UPI0013D0D8CE|nr:electron transport complex subunit RsxG [Spartinivicinus ruber]